MENTIKAFIESHNFSLFYISFFIIAAILIVYNAWRTARRYVIPCIAPIVVIFISVLSDNDHIGMIDILKTLALSSAFGASWAVAISAGVFKQMRLNRVELIPIYFSMMGTCISAVYAVRNTNQGTLGCLFICVVMLILSVKNTFFAELFRRRG
jgi:membrane protein